MQHLTAIPGNRHTSVGNMLKAMVTANGCRGDQHMLRACLDKIGIDPEMGGAVTKLGLCDCETLHKVYNL